MTSARVAGETSGWALITRETVAVETPATSATSSIVTRAPRSLTFLVVGAPAWQTCRTGLKSYVLLVALRASSSRADDSYRKTYSKFPVLNVL